MKKTVIIPLVLLAAACQQMETEQPLAPTKENASTCNLTINASKGAPETKALDLINDGATLNAYWQSGESVKVFKAGTLLGSLDVTPAEGEKPTTATLGGNIAGLAQNDGLTLLLPRETWDYTGQNGKLTGENSIEQKYAYATAEVNVTGINNNSVRTTNANFTNAESIYRFGFKNGENYLSPKSFTVTSEGNKLVQSMSWNGSGWEPAYGGHRHSGIGPRRPFLLRLHPQRPDHGRHVQLRNHRRRRRPVLRHQGHPRLGAGRPQIHQRQEHLGHHAQLRPRLGRD